MNPIRPLLVVLALALSGAALGQSSERGSLPPGQSRDGAAPADGAIKGGAILPGEASGLPDKDKVEQRCEELTGTLREDCLKRQRDAAAAGETRPVEILDPTGTPKQAPLPAR